MPIGLAFWILMLLWLVLGVLPLFSVHLAYGSVASVLLLFVLLLLLGWSTFGSPIKGGRD